MSGVIQAASTDQYAAVKLWTSADGSPKTDVTNSTSGLSIKYQVNNGAIQTVSSPASMSAGGNHADWGIYHRGNGWYVIGLADAVVATAGNRVTVWIELADCDSMPAEIYVSGYDGALVAVGASTFDHTADEVTTDADSRTASRADVSGLATQADVTDAQTALATAIDGKLTTARLTKIDNLPSAWPTNLNLLSIDGSGRVLIGASQAADIFAQADLDAIRQAFINAFDGADDQAIIAFEAAVDRRLAAYDAPTLTAAAILADPANKLLTNAAGNVTTSNPATGGTGSAHTAADVAELILANPANKIATNATGQVSASNAATSVQLGATEQALANAINDAAFDPALQTVTLSTAQFAELFSDADSNTKFGDFLDSLLENFDEDTDGASIAFATATVNRLMTNPTFVTLVANALAAKNAAESNSTEIAKVPKQNENRTWTIGGSDPSVIRIGAAE